MRCIMMGLVLAACLGGCQIPERAALKPLPPDAPPLAYSELTLRIQDQIDAAQKFFYRDDWESLVEASTAIKLSSDALAKIKLEEIPEKHRDGRDGYVKTLAESSDLLGESAKVKDANKCADAMQSLHKTLRLMKAKP